MESNRSVGGAVGNVIIPLITETMSLSEYMSYVFGALYLSLWSLSFYPQLWENYKRNQTIGFSYDFAFLQTLGYFLFCIYAYASRIEMIGRNHTISEKSGGNFDFDNYEQVDRADLAFATHAFLMSAAIFSQCQVLTRGQIGDQKTLNKWAMNLAYFVVGLVILSFAVEISIDETNTGKAQSSRVILPLSVQTQLVCGYGLVILHVAKYLPQFFRNQKRKSTVGLSLKMVIFDLSGSGFALMQILMDSMYLSKKQQNKTYNHVNIIKLFMTTTSVAFDVLFLMQHCLLYREAVVQDLRRQEMEELREHRQEVAQLIDKRLKDMPFIQGSVQNSVQVLNNDKQEQMYQQDNQQLHQQQQQFQSDNYNSYNYPMLVQNYQVAQDQDQSQIEMLDQSYREFFGLNRGGGGAGQVSPIQYQTPTNAQIKERDQTQYYNYTQQYYSNNNNYNQQQQLQQ